MNPRDVREFARRDWAAIRAAKQDYWSGRLRREGVEPLLGVAATLRDLVRTVQPDWPRPEDRAADYEHHVVLKRLLDRARHAFARD